MVSIANDPWFASQHSRSDDIVLLDNERFGHGRCHVVGASVAADGTAIVNPRTLWSINVE